MTNPANIKFLLILSLVLFTTPGRLFSQERVVTGTVTDHRNLPVTGVTVCRVNSTDCTSTDLSGLFHLFIAGEGDVWLRITCPGFNPAEATVSDTTRLPLRITLTPLAYYGEDLTGEPDDNSYSRFALRSALAIDIFRTDFSEFTALLGEHNTAALAYQALTGPEIGVSGLPLSASLGLGLGYKYSEKHDTFIVDQSSRLIKLTVGYDLVSSARIRLTPQLSVRWLRTRLQNYDAERKITLEKYLRNGETDLRFNQTMAVAGVNLEVLFYTGMKGFGDYWSVALFGGYPVRLHRTPWIWSAGNRITTDSTIKISPLTAGITLSFYTR